VEGLARLLSQRVAPSDRFCLFAPMLTSIEAAIQKAIAESAADLAKQIGAAVRQALAVEVAGTPVRRGPGRPPKSASSAPMPAPKPKKKRNISPEGRARMQVALKKRWAAYRVAQKGK
jgi:hypothetical protein